VVEVERVDFVAVPTRGVPRAREFYKNVLGLHESTPPDDTWPEFETSNVTLGLYEPEKIGRPFAPTSGLVLRVPDVAEARRKLEEAGVAFLMETADSGVCHMAFFEDPDGNGLAIHRRYAPPRPEGMSHAESRKLVEHSCRSAASVARPSSSTRKGTH
jgi:predicted enzyme related to lactoylglutathione lyase